MILALAGACFGVAAAVTFRAAPSPSKGVVVGQMIVAGCAALGWAVLA